MEGTAVRAAMLCDWRMLLDAPTLTAQETPLLDAPTKKLGLYKRRWLVLGVFFMLALMNNLATYTYSPVAVAMEQYYRVGKTPINSLVLVFMLSGFTFRFLAMWMIDNIGLGVGVCLASILNMLGCWLRVYPGTIRSLGFGAVFAGQSVCAVGQAFVDIAAPKIAANWFPPEQRTTATAIGYCPLYLALFLSYLLGPLLIPAPSSTLSPSELHTVGRELFWYVGMEAVLSTLSCVAVLACFRGRPPQPPSRSANSEKSSSVQGLVALSTNRNFLLLFAVFCTAGGGAVAFSTLLSQLVESAGYSEAQGGWCGSLWVGTAIVSSALAGPLIDASKNYRLFMLLAFGPGALFSLIFAFFIAKIMPHSPVLLYAVCLALGLAGGGIPAVMEAAIEVSFPTPEATVMGILFLGLNLFSIVFVLLLSSLPSYALGTWILVGFAFCSVCFLVPFRPDYRRLAFERESRLREDIAASASVQLDGHTAYVFSSP